MLRVEENCGLTSVIVGVVCSLLFLAIGVLLGAVGLYLILRGRGKLSGSAPSSSTPPAVTYEEVGVAREVKRSQDIQLTSNEAYGPVIFKPPRTQPTDKFNCSCNAVLNPRRF